jgi:thiol-disulfide isomerase/thioredoxin
MRALLLLALVAALVGCKGAGPDSATKDDPAAQTVAAIEAIQLPVLNASGDPDMYQAKYEKAWAERAPLVLKMLETHPDDSRTAKYADQYWQSLMRKEMDAEDCDQVIADIKARGQAGSEDLKKHAAFWVAFYSSYRDRNDVDKVLDHADEFSRAFPNDPRGATLFSFASMSGMATRGQMERAFSALIARYASTNDGQFARAMLPLMDNVGKTFDFDFKDAITGERRTDEMYRGKVLVIDWWATWCGPCIEALPRMRQTYAKYKGLGVEFIGVSIDAPTDQGGRQALREFVAKNDMPWPQYHVDGDGFDQKWKVAQIPTVFVVDKAGKVVSIDGYRTLDRTLEGLVGTQKG